MQVLVNFQEEGFGVLPLRVKFSVTVENSHSCTLNPVFGRVI